MVKRYYLMLSRLSLGVILLQVLIFLHCGLSTEKFNRRIDGIVSDLSGKTCSNPAFEAVCREAGARLAQIQWENREHRWLLKVILLGGVLHIGICYSLYIHFLRMGYSWTKVCLHANNLSLVLWLPSPAGFAWMLVYIVGTRAYKHRCVTLACTQPCPET